MQQNGASPRRRRHQNSGNSESSVEVLPDLETDEQKFENALLAAGPFWSSLMQNFFSDTVIPLRKLIHE